MTFRPFNLAPARAVRLTAELAGDRAKLNTPAWLTAGFRPFFFLGSIAMAVSALAWLLMIPGMVSIPTAFGLRDWHVHSMLFGGVPAIIAGFALTAVSNWTGRPPVAGRELLVLVLLWIVGRIAVSTSAIIGAGAAAAVDLLFPIALVLVFAREVVAGGNLRNLRIVAMVALLGLANAAFHAEAGLTGAADYSLRAGLSVVLLLIMLVGGRIIPAFTRNWLAARGATRLPAPFSRTDGISMATSAAALAAWSALPYAGITATLCAIAGAANLYRLSRWCGLCTRSEPLLAILHVGYLTAPLGFLGVAISILAPDFVGPAGAVHIWTMGTIGAVTLGVMTRASRGHSGRSLNSGKLEVVIFALVLTGTAARVIAPSAGGLLEDVLTAAGLAWSLAYLVFAIGYAPLLLAKAKK